MEAQLKAFLDECRVSKGEPCTHTTKSTADLKDGWYSGSYYIEGEYLEKFWTIYCNHVRKKKIATVTEYPGAYGPLRVDFDFKSSLDNGLKRQYTEDMLKTIVGIYQDEIRRIVPEDEFEDEMTWCAVLEKPAPRVEEGQIKDGFHLHFPNFICEGWLQDFYLRDIVVTKMIEQKVWKNGSFNTSAEEVIDRNMARKPWMMYGSMNYKGKESKPYLFNRWTRTPEDQRYGHMFNHQLEDIHPMEMFQNEMIGRKNSVAYYLPRFFSIRGCNQITPLKDEVSAKRSFHSIKKTNGRRKRQLPKRRSHEAVLEDLKLIEEGEIMNMISDDRAESYDDWMDMGWTLFNIGQGCEEALNMWVEFSKRSGKYVEGECDDLWSQMDVRDKTIASLLAMAKSDSPDEYNAWKETNIRYYLWNSLWEEKPNEYDVAMVVYKMFGDHFVCADASKDLWYEFRDHRWHHTDDGITLKNILVEDVKEKYISLRSEIRNELATLEDAADRTDNGSEKSSIKSDQADLILKKKRCSAIITALKTVSFHRKVLEMCKLKMYDKDFTSKVDENKLLLGCENGVLDLDMKMFRDGRPDDYITFSTGLYYQKYNPNDEEVIELDDCLSKIYPNKKRKKYFEDFMASCMQGGNIHKRFLIMTGNSDGAKSMTVALLELVFGSGNQGYFGKFGREMMVGSTNSNSSSSARPELARVRGKRIMGVQEITSNETVNIGFIKEATGNDSFYTRGLYEKGTEIKPMFTLLMQCNDPPKIPGHDEATWSRIRVLDHEAKFVKPQDREKFPVPESPEEQMRMKRFPADPEFAARLPDLAPVLLWRLFEIYKRNKTNGKGLEEPKEVLIATEIYKSDNDVYLEFIRDRIEKVEDQEEAKTAFIKLADAYQEFKDWYAENHPSYSREKIGKSTMKKELNKRLGVIRDDERDTHGFGKLNRWWGYRFIQEDDEEDDYKALLGGDDGGDE